MEENIKKKESYRLNIYLQKLINDEIFSTPNLLANIIYNNIIEISLSEKIE